MLYQIVIYWDDILAYTAIPSTTEITITKDINLYGGSYRATVVGFNWLDNKSDGVSAVNQSIINFRSSKFVFPASSSQGLFFTNRNEHVNPSIDGHLSFRIDAIAGKIDLTFSCQQFLVGKTKNPSATWNDTGMIAFILSLNIEEITNKRESY